MSSIAPVFPINHLSFTTDRSITNVYDVINHLAQFEKTVKKYSSGSKNGKKDVVYGTTSSDVNADIVIARFSIGPLEISIAFNPSSGSISLQVFLVIPIIGTVLVGAVTGSLKDGVSVEIGFGDILSGTVGIKRDGNDTILYWEFTAFGDTYDGNVKLPF